jgi:hypothetical protein
VECAALSGRFGVDSARRRGEQQKGDTGRIECFEYTIAYDQTVIETYNRPDGCRWESYRGIWSRCPFELASRGPAVERGISRRFFGRLMSSIVWIDLAEVDRCSRYVPVGWLVVRSPSRRLGCV